MQEAAITGSTTGTSSAAPCRGRRSGTQRSPPRRERRYMSAAPSLSVTARSAYRAARGASPRKRRAKNTPSPAFTSVSSTSESAVGAILPRPWKYPRRTEMTAQRRTAGARKTYPAARSAPCSAESTGASSARSTPPAPPNPANRRSPAKSAPLPLRPKARSRATMRESAGPAPADVSIRKRQKKG